MSARDFINDTLLPWLEKEITDEAAGSKLYIKGFEDAMRAMTGFIEAHRNSWDSAE